MFARGTNQYNHGHRVNAKVVILGKAKLQPDSHGINIWAKNGDLVFTSSSIQAGTGGIKKISKIEGEKIGNMKKPMFIPATLGIYGSATYQLCNDNDLIVGVPLLWSQSGINNFKPTRGAHVFIDASDYFYFE
ncbi:hypothetical protein B7L51_003980 [Pectobacterium brasiliense]|nr:hypothetical protein [Pectobacterium carotovorum]OYN52681.1 hypothetical protein B7L51_04025 [Pectobacterium carotovorum]